MSYLQTWYKPMWKKVKRFNYEVNKKGEVRNINTKRILSPRIHRRYSYKSVAVVLFKDGVGKETQISRLVAFAFLPKKRDKNEVNHINHDATDNRLKNLEWVSHKENLRYAMNSGRIKHGEDAYGARFTNKEALKVFLSPERPSTLARKHQVSPQTIRDIKRKKRYVKVINTYLVAQK